MFILGKAAGGAKAAIPEGLKLWERTRRGINEARVDLRHMRDPCTGREGIQLPCAA